MSYPVYDNTTLPCITFPFTTTTPESTRYLGNNAKINDVEVSVNLIARSDTELHALHLFWEQDCNYGLDPFVISVPLHGEDMENIADNNPEIEYLASFAIVDTVDNRNDGHWKSSRRIIIHGEMGGLVDDSGNDIVNDADEIISSFISYPTTHTVNRRVIYGVDNPTPETSTAVPIYDDTVLPCLTYPFSNKQSFTKKFLGNRAYTGAVYANITLKSSEADKVSALYAFWRDDCNYGLEPFIFNMPIFGIPMGIDILVMFTKELKTTKNNTTWSSSMQLKVLGRAVYTEEVNGDFTLSDSGDFVLDVDGNYIALPSKIYKEITYA